MLILTRKPGESLYIGDNIKITIVEIKGNQIRVGIDAPKELRIYREEIWLQILEENKEAAEAAVAPSGLEGLSKTWGSGAKDKDKGGFQSLGSSGKREPQVVVKKKKGNKGHD